MYGTSSANYQIFKMDGEYLTNYFDNRVMGVQSSQDAEGRYT